MAEARLIRNNILTSDPVNSLSWSGEVFYRRLLHVVDDFGRYDAREDVLRADLYKLKLDIVSKADVAKWKNECSEAGLISLYSVDGKNYLEVLKFGQRLRSKKSKFPPPAAERGEVPPSAAECGDPRAEEKGSRSEVEEEGEQEGAPQLSDENPDLMESNLFRQPTVPTKQEVWEFFKGQGATAEMAKSFWLKHEGTAWFIGNSPIKNWSAVATRFIANWNSSDFKDQQQSSAPPLKRG
ncbi:MAG: hypothetical protein ACTHMM_18355 [Agriterribacter sp.]